jgi:uncharacterized membrane protein YgcG
MTYVTLGRGPCPTPRVRRNRRASPQVAEAARLSGYMVTGDNAINPFDASSTLGFSLKPPKWLRKASVAVRRNVTIKRVAIGAGAIIAAPFVLPALAAGGGALLAAGRAVGVPIARGAISLFKRNPSPGVNPNIYGPPDPGASLPPLTLPTGLPTPTGSGGGGPSTPGDFSPYGGGYGGGGGPSGGGGAPSVADQVSDPGAAPAAAGMGGGALLPLAIGVGVLMLMRKRGR